MYGYKIVDGKVIVDEQEAAVVINIFNGYLSGMSLRDAAVNAGRPMVHSMVKRIISNFCYVGDDRFLDLGEGSLVILGDQQRDGILLIAAVDALGLPDIRKRDLLFDSDLENVSTHLSRFLEISQPDGSYDINEYWDLIWDDVMQYINDEATQDDNIE